MNVRFLLKVPPGLVRNEKGEMMPYAPVEYVEISGQHAGDVTCRRATDADRSRFKGEYQAFKAEHAPKPVAPKSVDARPPTRAEPDHPFYGDLSGKRGKAKG